ncbi:MAG: hypothetical protein ACRD2T_01365 [Thermoanaerobaculia bacterium]
MQRRELLKTLGLAASGLAFLGGTRAAAAEEHAGQGLAPHEAECLKACTECLGECGSCHEHCTQLVAEGKRVHLRALKHCSDCVAVRAVAAQLSRRVVFAKNVFCLSRSRWAYNP